MNNIEQRNILALADRYISADKSRSNKNSSLSDELNSVFYAITVEIRQSLV